MFGLFGGKKPESPQTFSDYLQQRAQNNTPQFGNSIQNAVHQANYPQPGLQNQMVGSLGGVVLTSGRPHAAGGMAGGYAIMGSTGVFTNEVHIESNLDFATAKRCLVILTDYVDSLLEKQLNSEFVTVAAEEKKIPDLRYLIKYLKGVVDDASNHWAAQAAIHQHQIANYQLGQAKAAMQNQYAGQTAGPKPNLPTTGSGVTFVACGNYDSKDPG